MTLAQIQLRDSCHKLAQIQFQLLTAFGAAFLGKHWIKVGTSFLRQLITAL